MVNMITSEMYRLTGTVVSYDVRQCRYKTLRRIPQVRSARYPSAPSCMLAKFAGILRNNGPRIHTKFPVCALSTHMNGHTDQAGFYEELLTSSGVYKYYVNGEWQESLSGKTVGITNPTTEATEYQVQGGG